jgi:hypothetical protein
MSEEAGAASTQAGQPQRECLSPVSLYLSWTSLCVGCGEGLPTVQRLRPIVPCLFNNLAYVTAKTNGLDELASEILESTGLTEADVEDLPALSASSLKPPPIVTATTELKWPSVSR